MSKINRISNRLSKKLNNVFKRVINERHLLKEEKGCDKGNGGDWDCGAGMYCGSWPPCEASACAYGSSGVCKCITNDCSGPEMVSNDTGGIEDIEVTAMYSGGDCYCVRHNGNQDDGYTPGINRCLEWSEDCGGKRGVSSDVRIAEARLLREYKKCSTCSNKGGRAGGCDGEGKSLECLGGAGTCVASHSYTDTGRCCYWGDCHGDSRIDNGEDVPMDALKYKRR